MEGGGWGWLPVTVGFKHCVALGSEARGEQL